MNEATTKMRIDRARALRNLADALERDEVGVIGLTAISRDGSLHKMLFVDGTPIDVYAASGVFGVLQFEAGEMATQALRSAAEMAKKVTVNPPAGGMPQ